MRVLAHACRHSPRGSLSLLLYPPKWGVVTRTISYLGAFGVPSGLPSAEVTICNATPQQTIDHGLPDTDATILPPFLLPPFLFDFSQEGRLYTEKLNQIENKSNKLNRMYFMCAHVFFLTSPEITSCPLAISLLVFNAVFSGRNRTPRDQFSFVFLSTQCSPLSYITEPLPRPDRRGTSQANSFTLPSLREAEHTINTNKVRQIGWTCRIHQRRSSPPFCAMGRRGPSACLALIS